MFNLFRMILLNTLLVVEGSIIPLQLIGAISKV